MKMVDTTVMSAGTDTALGYGGMLQHINEQTRDQHDLTMLVREPRFTVLQRSAYHLPSISSAE